MLVNNIVLSIFQFQDRIMFVAFPFSEKDWVKIIRFLVFDAFKNSLLNKSFNFFPKYNLHNIKKSSCPG